MLKTIDLTEGLKSVYPDGHNLKRLSVTLDSSQKVSLAELEDYAKKAIADRLSGKTETLTEFPESGREKKTVKEALDELGC